MRRCVSVHNHMINLGVRVQRLCDGIQNWMGWPSDPRASLSKLNALQDHDLGYLHTDAAVVRASIFIADAVVCLGLAWAGVAGINDVVAISVKVRTSIRVLDAIDIFSETRARVLRVDDAIVIAVEITTRCLFDDGSGRATSKAEQEQERGALHPVSVRA